MVLDKQIWQTQIHGLRVCKQANTLQAYAGLVAKARVYRLARRSTPCKLVNIWSKVKVGKQFIIEETQIARLTRDYPTGQIADCRNKVAQGDSCNVP